MNSDSIKSPAILIEYMTKAKIKIVQDGLKFKYMPDNQDLE
jgi:hypothetical protein